MNLKSKLLGLNTLLMITLLLSACFPPTPTPAPTVDTNMLFTQAAQTVVAQLTANAPTRTPTTAVTNTPLPSMTPLGGALPTLPPLATLPALATPTRQGYTGADKALYITQSPSDYATVKTGQVFNITWRLRNTGTTTWTQNYAYRFYSAVNKLPTNANGYNLTATVAPNAEVELTVVATAPGSPGTYDTRWVLTNANGENFASFDLTVNVIQNTGSSSAATATGAPNACDAVQTADGDYGFSGAGPNTQTFTMSGGQVRIPYDVTTDITGGSLTYEYVNQYNASDKQSNTISITAAGAITIGDPDKDAHTLTISGKTTTGTFVVSGISSVSSNSSCW